MIDKLTYKVRFIAFMVAIPLLLLFAYKKSIASVFKSKNILANIKEQKEQAETAQKELSKLQNEVQILDGIIGKEVINSDVVQQEIFDIFSKISTKCSLDKLFESHKFNDDYYTVYTNSILLSGTFNDIIETAYLYEKEFQYSRVVNMSFYTKKNYRTKSTKLFSKLIFQNYEKK